LRQKLVIYPGSFDPPTNGHLDLITRASSMFNHVVVAALNNDAKAPLFAVEERMSMLRAAVAAAGLENITVDSFDGLLVDYARRLDARLILRGIRAISDYEYELQMALMNRKLEPAIETVFMMPAETYSYLSSRLVKEIYRLGGSVHDLVPPIVLERLRAKVV
jgi:pantetheine-phosphate adenylyltransferase